MQLTNHRVHEIFSAVSHSGNDSEINDKEFEDALAYLHVKSSIMTLDALVQFI